MKNRQRFAHFLATALFALSALSFFKNGETLLSVFLVIISLLNLLILRGLAAKEKWANVSLHVLNSLAAALTAYSYFQAETKYLQWAWVVTATLFFVLAVSLFFRKEPTIRPFRKS